MQGFQPNKAKKDSAQRRAVKPVGGFSANSPKPEEVQAMNQAPDTELGMFKPGEYVLPVDTVHALGGPDKLDAVVQQTHTPAPEQAVVPDGAEPRLFFSNGGRVPDEEGRQRLATVPASMQRRENTTFAPDNSIQPTNPAAQAAVATPRAPQVATAAASPNQTSPSNIYPQSHPAAGAQVYKGAGFSADGLGSSGKLASVPSTIGQQPGRQAAPQYPAPQYPANYAGQTPETEPASMPTADPMAGKAAFGFNPNITAMAERAAAGVPQPSTTAATTNRAGVPMGTANSPTAMFVSEASADAGKRWDQGDVAGAIGAGLRTVGGGFGMAAVEALDNTVGAAARGVVNGGGRMLDGLLGSQAQATPAAPPAPAANAAKPATTSALAQQTAASTAAAPATTSAAAPAATGSTTGQSGEQLPAGVYQHGRGQYSDNAQGMGFSPGFTGRPNAQNLNAASNLSAQSMRDSASRVMAQPASQPQARGFRAPTVNTSANDFTTREALRRAKMDASSLIHSSSWAPQGSGKAAQERYNQMQQADLAAQAQQGTMDMQAMGFNAGMAREQLQQDGALQRALIEQTGDAARLGLEERRLAGEEAARGFQVRQSQRLEQAQTAYLNAKTPEEQASALATMRALSGKGEGSLKDNYMSLGGGQEWDPQANTMRNVPQRLVDLRTGQEVGGQKALPPINQNPQALAIKNNTSMNSDQKRKALQELGYR